MKNCIFSFVALLLLAFSTTCSDMGADAHIITVLDGGKPYNSMMYLNRKHWTWGMAILENTLNDTAKVGIMEIPPQKIGSLFKIECFMDSIPFTYQPYRATKGRLVIEYYSKPY